MANKKPDDEPTNVVRDFAARAMRTWADKGPTLTLDERRKAEKPLPAKTDGRRLRATGRDQQFNIKVKAVWRAEIEALAQERNIGMAEMLERILAEWKKLGGKGLG